MSTTNTIYDTISLHATMNNLEQLGTKYLRRVATQKFEDIGDTVVIYFHIPKCGGTSIVEAFWKTIPEKDIFLMRDLRSPLYHSWPSDLSKSSLNLTKGKLTFIEYHGCERPSFVDIAKSIPAIRANIKAKGGNVIIFTVLRSPVEAVLSLRNYMCVVLKKNRACRNATDYTIFKDFQLNYLDSGYATYLCPRLTPAVTKNDFNSIVRTMEHSLDYVGFVERLWDTFDTLQRFLNATSPGLNINFLHNITTAKVNERIDHNNPLSAKKWASTIDHHKLKQSQFLDFKMYDHFTKHLHNNYPGTNHNFNRLLAPSRQVEVATGKSVGIYDSTIVILLVIVFFALYRINRLKIA